MNAICNPTYQVPMPECGEPDAVDSIRRCLDRNPKTRISLQELLDHTFLHPNRHNRQSSHHPNHHNHPSNQQQHGGLQQQQQAAAQPTGGGAGGGGGAGAMAGLTEEQIKAIL
ncbi:Dual specificity protein kinase Ttk, partial [Tetrabaena socialis]